MSNIDVHEIASRLIDLHKPFGTEEIEKLVNERFNGKQIPIENLANEIIMMVGELIGKVRGQDYKFMIDLIQATVDEIEKTDETHQ